MIDTGNGGISDYVVNLKETLSTNGTSIQEILVTHWHADHVGGIADVMKLVVEESGWLGLMYICHQVNFIKSAKYNTVYYKPVH